MLNFGRLGTLAKEKGLSAAYLCEKAGKNRTYLANVKRYNITVPYDTLEIWADALGTTAEYLCDETDDPNPPAVAQEEIKVALFGGENCTDEEWEQVKQYVEFLKSKRK